MLTVIALAAACLAAVCWGDQVNAWLRSHERGFDVRALEPMPQMTAAERAERYRNGRVAEVD